MQNRIIALFAALTVTNDILLHDNRCIQHQTDGKCQAGQRNYIEGETKNIQRDKCTHQRHGNRHRNQQRHAHTAQEKP